MAKNSKDAYGAVGKSNVLFFKPESLKLVTDEAHPLYDPRVTRELDEAFIANVNHFGIIEPIVVRKNPETGDTEVIAGRQRVRAVLAANVGRKDRGEPLLQVPAVVRRGEDLALMGAMATENEARVGNSPLERAKLMQRMLDRGAAPADLERAFACSASTVKNALALLEAPKAVRNAVERGSITAASAYKLSKLPAEEAKEKLAELETVAPRIKGHRSANKAREILGEGAPVTRKMVERMRDEVEESSVIGGEFKRQISACLNALLGDSVEWMAIVGTQAAAE